MIKTKDFHLFALHHFVACHWLLWATAFFSTSRVVAATVRVDYWLIKIRRNARCSARWTKADSWNSSSFWTDGWTKELRAGRPLPRVVHVVLKKEVQQLQYVASGCWQKKSKRLKSPWIMAPRLLARTPLHSGFWPVHIIAPLLERS